MRRAIFLLLVLGLAACGGGDEKAGAPTATVAPAAGVEELDNVLALRSDFEADAGKARVIVLLSPT